MRTRRRATETRARPVATRAPSVSQTRPGIAAPNCLSRFSGSSSVHHSNGLFRPGSTETTPGGYSARSAIIGSPAAQRATIHRQGLQAVHSNLGHNPRQNFALLSSIRTKRSNAGTNRSRESASGRERHFRWMMHGVWWRVPSGITTPPEQRGGLITPKDMLPGRQAEIHSERDRKSEEARKTA